MRFLVDAQLPPLVASILCDPGHDAVHSRSLVLKNNTPDTEILALCLAENRILITKDLDFYHSKMVRNEPSQLVMVKVGNMRARNFLDLIRAVVPLLESALEQGHLIELHDDRVIVIR